MGQVKAYAEWAKEEGYLDSNYKSIDKTKGDMDYVDKYVKVRDKMRSSNMASSHFTNLINKPKEKK